MSRGRREVVEAALPRIVMRCVERCEENREILQGQGPGLSEGIAQKFIIDLRVRAPLMEFRPLEKEKNTLRLEIDAPDDTIIYPLIGELLKDDDVAEAKYSVGHPQLDKPVLYVRTKKGNPTAAIKRASDNLAGQFREARKLFEAKSK